MDGVKTETRFDWTDVKRHLTYIIFICFFCYFSKSNLSFDMPESTFIGTPCFSFLIRVFVHLPLRFSSVSHSLVPSCNYLYDTFSTAFRLWSISSISFLFLFSLTFSFLSNFQIRFSSLFLTFVRHHRYRIRYPSAWRPPSLMGGRPYGACTQP